MKKGVVSVFVICAFCVSTMMWTTGCTDKKPAADTLVVDSVPDTAAVDTMDQLISEQQMPKAADELFDDFIFNFAANRKLQMKRIVFPLKVVDGKKVSYIQKSKWKMEHFFMNQGYYTLIFDNTRQMNVVKDTSINNVVVEKVYLKRKKVKKYMFESTMTGEIDPGTWPAFAPELPADFIYNIMYGQKYTEGRQKIFVMRGIANGMEMQLTFKRIGGNWKLTKLSE